MYEHKSVRYDNLSDVNFHKQEIGLNGKGLKHNISSKNGSEGF